MPVCIFPQYFTYVAIILDEFVQHKLNHCHPTTQSGPTPRGPEIQGVRGK